MASFKSRMIIDVSDLKFIISLYPAEIETRKPHYYRMKNELYEIRDDGIWKVYKVFPNGFAEKCEPEERVWAYAERSLCRGVKSSSKKEKAVCMAGSELDFGKLLEEIKNFDYGV